MSSINKVIIIGRVGKDPELKYTAAGDAICNLSVATSESWKDKNTGEKKEQTEWHKVSFFGKLAEISGQYLKKGSHVYIEGSLRTRKWQNKDGQDQYTTEIRAETMKMLGSRDGDSGDAPKQERPSQSKSRPAQNQAPQDDFDDTDIPFD